MAHIRQLLMTLALTGFAASALANPIVLAYPGATDTYGYDINNTGYVVGGNYDGLAYIFDGANYTPVEFEGYDHPHIGGISDGGLIGGSLLRVDNSTSYGFLSDTNLSFLQTLPYGVKGVNDAGYIVGSAPDTNTFSPFAYVFDGTTYTRLDQPDWDASEALDINNNGEIVGVYLENGTRHGFITDVAMSFFTTIDVPGGVPFGGGTSILGINDNGDLVGNYDSLAGGVGPAVFSNFYFDGTNFHDILLDDIDLLYVTGINNNRDIVGSFKPSDSGLGAQSGQSTLGIVFNANDLKSVPAPATLALFGLGLAGLGWSRRKKA